MKFYVEYDPGGPDNRYETDLLKWRPRCTPTGGVYFDAGEHQYGAVALYPGDTNQLVREL